MSLRNRYLLAEMARFFMIFLFAVCTLLFVIQIFWSVTDARETGIFPWKDYLINLHSNVTLVFPLVTALSIFFVFTELEKFSEIAVLEIKGINALSLLKVFFVFSFFTGIIGFVAGSFPPYPGKSVSSRKSGGPVRIATGNFILWAGSYDRPSGEFDNIILVEYQRVKTVVFRAAKARLDNNTLILNKGSREVFGTRGRENLTFSVLPVRVSFNAGDILEYASSSVERLPFFKLKALLSTMRKFGVFSRKDWIVLYSKISYPMLNPLMSFLLLPFYYYRKTFSRARIFILSFFLSLGIFTLYTLGLSLGKSEMINWRLSPWFAHIIIVFFGLLYLSRKEKFSIIFLVKQSR